MEGKVYLIHRVVVQVEPVQVARGEGCSVGVMWLVDCCQLVWIEEYAFELPSFIAVAVSRVLHAREVDAVLFVFHEVEVAHENSGLFDGWGYVVPASQWCLFCSCTGSLLTGGMH